MKLKVIESYNIAYTNPIKLSIGDLVKIVKWETNPDWLGWVFVTDKNDHKGWIYDKCLQIDNQTALIIKDYDATELTVTEGEFVTILNVEAGWAWARSANGSHGWVPLKNLSEI